jgi:hypothetical protein
MFLILKKPDFEGFEGSEGSEVDRDVNENE